MNRIRAVLAGASPGPWEVRRDGAYVLIKTFSGQEMRLSSGDGPIREEDLDLLRMLHDVFLVASAIDDPFAETISSEPSKPEIPPEVWSAARSVVESKSENLSLGDPVVPSFHSGGQVEPTDSRRAAAAQAMVSALNEEKPVEEKPVEEKPELDQVLMPEESSARALEDSAEQTPSVAGELERIRLW